ncbi:MAG: flippase-like domain-containing protein [candidate division Zixibacteria bacterium]|nr:flippase-like domain-containing protein [candidate division Zixibacteria bacterium]
MTRKRIVANLVKLTLTGIILYFVGRQVAGQWDAVRDYDWQLDPLWFAGSCVPALAAFFCFSTSWKMIIGGFGHRLSAPMAFKISYLSHLGRYIPGKIWQVFGMLYLAKKEGVPEEQAGASFVLFQLFTIPASILVYVLAAQAESRLLSDKVALLGQGSTLIIGIAMLAACAVLIFWPAPILKAANAVLVRFGRPPAKFMLDKRVALVIFGGYFVGWVLFGLAFWMFLKAVLGDTAPSATAAVGLYNIAYQIGYLTLFAPGGFGPRELVMGLLLTPFIGPIAAAVAVLARLWSVAIETVAALMALLIRR